MNNQLLKKYKAKSDDTTIYQHNKDLSSILKQLENIHKINNSNNITSANKGRLFRDLHIRHHSFL